MQPYFRGSRVSPLRHSCGTNRSSKVILDLSTISGFIAWIVVFITYLRFRKALEYNNMMEVRPYKTPLQPYATWFCLLVISVLTLTNGFNGIEVPSILRSSSPLTLALVFFPSQWSASNFLAAYITLPIFLALYLGHKIYFATYSVTRGDKAESGSKVKRWFKAWNFAMPIHEIDVMSGKAEMDALEAMDVPPVPRNFVEKFWFWLA